MKKKEMLITIKKVRGKLVITIKQTNLSPVEMIGLAHVVISKETNKIGSKP